MTFTNTTPVAVIGAGIMGAGIAQIAAMHGHPVLLYDNNKKAAKTAINNICLQLQIMVDKGKISLVNADAAKKQLKIATELADLSNSGLVVEAIIEDLTIKQNLFAQLEKIVPSNCLLASNTSSISITAIAKTMQKPERLAGMHFFNPAPVMKLVEVVRGMTTNQAVLQDLMDIAKAWKKIPVLANSTPGFIVNRVARPFYAEALRLAQEGASDYATIDAVIRDAGGFRMGPFELMDLIGNDTNNAVTCSVWNAFYQDSRFRPSLLQQSLVAAGFFGRKTKRGFYDYREGAVPAAPASEALQTQSTSNLEINLYGETPACQAIKARLDKACIKYQAHLAMDDERIAETGGTAIYITDGRTATDRARNHAKVQTVLIDWALNYQSAKRVAISAALNSTAEGVNLAVQLLQLAGFAVSKLADTPGLIVMRTVSMLANEAADAVYQGVAAIADVDTAMCMGVNYPKGPLAWADVVGIAAIHNGLTNLQAFYNEERYRLSPLIRQNYYANRNFYES